MNKPGSAGHRPGPRWLGDSPRAGPPNPLASHIDFIRIYMARAPALGTQLQKHETIFTPGESQRKHAHMGDPPPNLGHDWWWWVRWIVGVP